MGWCSCVRAMRERLHLRRRSGCLLRAFRPRPPFSHKRHRRVSRAMALQRRLRVILRQLLLHGLTHRHRLLLNLHRPPALPPPAPSTRRCTGMFLSRSIDVHAPARATHYRGTGRWKRQCDPRVHRLHHRQPPLLTRRNQSCVRCIWSVRSTRLPPPMRHSGSDVWPCRGCSPCTGG